MSSAWLPQKKSHVFSVASNWMTTLPLIIAFLTHKAGQRNLKNVGGFSILTFLALAGGLVYQINQMSNMPFIDPETHTFDGAYASSWVLMAGANTFHYIVGTFIALGLVIRARRANVDPTLEKWRMRTAASWFTWIAISGVIVAFALSLA